MSDSEIFKAAVKLSPDRRNEYLDQVCGAKRELRREVESLLRAHDASDSFLEKPAAGFIPTHAFAHSFGDTVKDSEYTLDFLVPSEKPDCLGTIGQYEVTEVAGRGGMGLVLKGFDPKLSRVVAIKVLAPELASNASARKRFLREGQAAAAISHDHVVTIYAIDDSGPLPFIAMEYVSGQSLQQRIDERGALELKEILRIGKQAATGLAAAHAEGLVHRDIKPGNMLLENGVQRVKISDFGLARAVDDVRITKPGMITGTPEYMSPEQARGEPVDHRSDLFSLGCVLYAMCTGRPPFRADNTVAMVHRVCKDTPRRISQINPEIPEWLAEIVDTLLCKNPDDRLQTAAEAGELLEAHLAHLQEPAVNPRPGRVGKTAAQARRQRGRSDFHRRWSLAAAVVLFLFAGLGLTEATGITEVTSTVIRIVRGDGTLVVEVDDPNVQVLIDGEELVFTGAGPKEIRLRPGKHEVHTLEDGKAIKKKLVTISRGGREVVRVTREKEPALAAGPTVRQVWSDFSLFNVIRGISPDGRYISHADLETGNLAIHELATGQNRVLTKTDAKWQEFTVEHIFSPDGQKVAFNWYRKDSSIELRIIGVDGSDERTLYFDPKTGYAAPRAWSPDGRQILAMLDGDMALISVANGSVHRPKTMESKVGGLRFSPDGRYIVYDSPSQEDSRKSDVFLLDIESSREIPLVEHAADDTVLGWSPDGRYILFSSDRRGATDAWLMPVSDGKATGRPKLLMPNIGPINPMGFARDGAFYYSTASALNEVYTAEIDLTEGKIISAPQPVSKGALGSNTAPAFSPDGRYVAYISQRGEFSDDRVIVIHSLETGEDRDVQTGLRSGRFHTLRWFPDGRAVAIAGRNRDDEDALYRVDVQTGEAEAIVPGGITSGLAIAPDGKTIYYTKPQDGGGKRRLLKRDLESGEEEELHRFAGWYWLALSLDGEHLAFWEGRSLKTTPTTGGQPREIHELAKGENRGGFDWTPDGQHLLFVKRIGKGKPQLWKVSVADGQSQSLGSAPIPAHLRLHADGRLITFAAGGTKRDIWVMENFLPPLSDTDSDPIDGAPNGTADFDEGKKPGPKQASTRRIWASAADPYFMGAPSSDSKYVSYVDWETGDVAVRELATGKNRRLTNEGWNEGFATYSIFSPDGKQLAYSWWNNKQNATELRVVGLDGSEPRVIHLDQETMLHRPAGWPADGEQILALGAAPDKSVQILSVPVRGGAMRVVKTLASHVTAKRVDVSLSPDGRHVAYSLPPEEGSTHRDIALVAVDGSHEAFLIQHPADDFVLGWAPDGNRVVFASDRTGSMGIWAIDVADGQPQGDPKLLKAEIGQFRPLGLTQDGSYHYGVFSGGANIYVAAFDRDQRNVTSEPVVTVKHYEGSNWAPAWSPDGKQLACLSRSPGLGPLFLIQTVETGNVQEVTPDLEDFNRHSLGWSPDGRWLIGVGKQTHAARWGTLKIDPRTGVVDTIAERGIQPNMAADGQSMLYVRRGGTGWRIIRRDLTTGDEQELFAAAVGENGVGAIIALALSPDGKQVAFKDLDAGVLKVLAVNGGAPRELAKVDGKITVAWTPDGNDLVYATRGLGKQPGKAWIIPVNGGQPEDLDIEMQYIDHIRFRPDGKQIAFTGKAGVDTSHVWILENFLP